MSASTSSSPIIRNILITGSSRGLGFEFVRQYVAEPNTHVIATARNLAKATALQELKKNHSNLTLIEMDVSSPESIRTALQSLPPLSVVINNAGIAVSYNGTVGATLDDLQTTFNTNVTGILLTIQATLDALQRAHKEYQVRPVVANISSTMGSIKAVNGRKLLDGKGALSYRMSKAAVNMLTATAAQEHPDITFVALCPGWVDTDMGRGGGVIPPLKPEQSIAGMRAVIDKIKPEQSGHFLSHDGTEVEY